MNELPKFIYNDLNTEAINKLIKLQNKEKSLHDKLKQILKDRKKELSLLYFKCQCSKSYVLNELTLFRVQDYSYSDEEWRDLYHFIKCFDCGKSFKLNKDLDYDYISLFNKMEVVDYHTILTNGL